MAIVSILAKLFSRTMLPSSVDALIVGLGNIGPAYGSTRHNIGFRVVDALCGRLSGMHHGCFADADFYSGTVDTTKRVVVVKPRTMMNRSGTAIERYLKKLGLPASRMLVVVDDCNLPIGRLRIREKGSDGGHNGLKSISHFCGEGFPRLRVGIGSPDSGKGDGTLIDFVLGKFTDTEEGQLKTVVPRAAEACELFVKSEIGPVMSKYNK